MDQNLQDMETGNTKEDVMTSNPHMKSPGWTNGWAKILDKKRGYTEEEWEQKKQERKEKMNDKKRKLEEYDCLCEKLEHYKEKANSYKNKFLKCKEYLLSNNIEFTI